MFCLKVVDGLSTGLEIPLRRGGFITVGRGSADGVIEDALCSGRHFQVEWSPTGMVIKDLDSLNGVFVNGERVRAPRKVKRGDFIQAGGTLMELTTVSASTEVKVSERAIALTGPATMLMDAAAVNDAIARTRAMAHVKAKERDRAGDKTRVVTREEMNALLAEQSTSRSKTVLLQALPSEILAQRGEGGTRLLEQLIDGLAPDNPTVWVVKKGATITPHAKSVITLGRDVRSDVPLISEDVSGAHARIVREGPSSFEIVDIGSTNGTFVNGKRVVRHALAHGDVLQVGSWTGPVAIRNGRLAFELRHEGITVADAGGIRVLKVGDVGAREWDPLLRERVKAVGPTGDRVQQVKKKKKGKSADDIAWRATSDVRRWELRRQLAWAGLMTAPAVLALLFAVYAGISMAGYASVLDPLSPGAVSNAHASDTFLARARASERTTPSASSSRTTCFACHGGLNSPVSETACTACHAQLPTSSHSAVGLTCFDCHGEHNGRDFSATAQARTGCTGCHSGDPHALLATRNSARTRARARALPLAQVSLDIDVHAVHNTHARIEGQCTACHAQVDDVSEPQDDASWKAFAQQARTTCGVCHAPAQPSAEECVRCHAQHPRTAAIVAFLSTTPTEDADIHRARVDPGTWPLVLLISLSMTLPLVAVALRKSTPTEADDEVVIEKDPAIGSTAPAPAPGPPATAPVPPGAAPPPQAPPPAPPQAPPQGPPEAPPPTPPTPLAPKPPDAPGGAAESGARLQQAAAPPHMIGMMRVVSDEDIARAQTSRADEGQETHTPGSAATDGSTKGPTS